jgi:hypothetical protein
MEQEQEEFVRISFARLAAILLAIGFSLGLSAQTAPHVTQPLAKPDASVRPTLPAAHAQRGGEVSDAPDNLIDAMQTGDRLGYYAERAVKEIAHFHAVLPQARAALAAIDSGFAARLDEYVTRMKARPQLPITVDYEAESARRLDAVAKAHLLVEEAGK